jgi:hypothetical protein
MADTTANVNLNYTVGGNAISALRQIRDLQREIADLQRQSGSLGSATGTGIGTGGMSPLANNQYKNWSSGFGIVQNQGGGGGGGSGGLSWQSAMSSMPQMFGRMILIAQETNTFLRSILLHVQQISAGGGGVGGGASGGQPRTPRTTNRAYEGLVGLARRYGGPLGVLASTVGPLGVAAGGSMLANYAAQGALNTGAELANIGSRGDLSSAQAQRRIGEATPLIGGLMKSSREFIEALSGMTEVIRRINVDMARQSTMNQAMAPYRQELARANIAAGSAREIAAGYNAASPVGFDSFDRGTVAGQMHFAEQSRRMPHLLAIASAERAAGAARVRGRITQEQANAAGNRAAMFSAQRDQAMQNLQGLVGPHAISVPAPGGPQGPNNNSSWGSFLAGGIAGNVENRPGIAQGAANVNNFNERAMQAEQLRIQLLRESQQAMREAAQAESTLRRANIGLLREEINILQTREQMVSQGAQRLGMMNPLQRRLGVMAAEMIEQRGVENVPWFMIQHAQQVAPNLVGRQTERAGEQSVEMQRLRQLGEFGDATQPLSELRRSIDQLSQQLNMDILRDEQLTTNAELATVNSNLEAILQALLAMARGELIGQDMGMIVSNNNQ